MQNSKTVDKKTRQEIEELIYKVYDTVDKTHTNSEYYKDIFSKMSNEEFYAFFEKRLPLTSEIGCKPHFTENELGAFLSFLTNIFFIKK